MKRLIAIARSVGRALLLLVALFLGSSLLAGVLLYLAKNLDEKSTSTVRVLGSVVVLLLVTLVLMGLMMRFLNPQIDRLQARVMRWREERRRSFRNTKPKRSSPSNLLTLPASAAHPGVSIAELLAPLYDTQTTSLTPTQAAHLRPLVLHWLGLRTDLADTAAAPQTAQTLRQRWFTLDLQHLDQDSDLRAALAFASLRVAVYLRAAHLLGWLDDAFYHTLKTLNTRRARDCCADWVSFLDTCATGRAQWQAHGRTDILGESLDPGQLRPWLWG